MNDLYIDQASSGKAVECLGMTFADDKARRDHFTRLLAEKLKDPAFRKQDGFPKGSDEAILAMSDPPYYTACPNPFLGQFVTRYGTAYDPARKYTREPLAIDVSVGKTDALYKAHGYHTKVPHLAIVPSILHYTEPGDLILDGFSGSGMSGVAAQCCASAPASYRLAIDIERKKQDLAAPRWGLRHAILNDLSPAASFIGANYNLPFDVREFSRLGRRILDEAISQCGWMYETSHQITGKKGAIEYIVWSEVFSCPECTGEINFVDEASDHESGRVRDEFKCPNCSADLNKKKLEKRFESTVDPIVGKIVRREKRVPSIIVYKVDGERHEKRPDIADLDLISQVERLPIPEGFPAERMMFAPLDQEVWGDKWRSGTASFSHVHHLFLPRARHALWVMWRAASLEKDRRLRNMALFFVEQAIWGMSLLARYTPTHFSQVNQYLTGVFYIGSQIVECSPEYILGGKLVRLGKVFTGFSATPGSTIATVGSASSIPIPDSCIDYIFTDPPFGDNLAYSELNFIVEAFHGVFTRQASEAVISDVQRKGLLEYHRLMRDCFVEYHRVLKPSRWMTVVFSNTQAAVWNGIQTALQEAGFVVANVSALNKMQGSFNAVNNATSVKQDLVISAYKPSGELEDRFQHSGGDIESVWDFMRSHLQFIPVTRMKLGQLELIKERDPRILFDRMVAWFVKHGAAVPLSSQEFQAGLFQRFSERDGMFFLPEQIAEYDRKRLISSLAPQAELFISDERSAIDWLTDFLRKRPSTYSEITPEYMPMVGAAKKKGELIPELDRLLDENFIQYIGQGDIPSQIHSYLSSNYKDLRSLAKNTPHLIDKAKNRWFVPDPNRAQDLEKKRERSLLREFEGYRSSTSGRKLKEFRLEVLRTGFRVAWSAKDYGTIINVAQKLPEEALLEDEKLLTLYDLALTRTELGA